MEQTQKDNSEDIRRLRNSVIANALFAGLFIAEAIYVAINIPQWRAENKL